MSFYIHGTDPDEQKRLSLLNTLLNDSALRELNLIPGQKVLDVGCGLAQLTRRMSEAVGESGKVVGVERSPEQIAEAIRQAREEGQKDLLEIRQGNATALPLRSQEWGSFDVAHARFLLEHVPEPVAVVRMMAQAVRSGGRIVLQDDDHDILRLFPEPEGFRELWDAYIQTYLRSGNDPYVGRRLVSILQQSGVTPARNTWLFFGSCQGHLHFSLYAENLISILSQAREAILFGKTIAEDEFREAIRNLTEWKRLPQAAIWYAVCYAEGICS